MLFGYITLNSLTPSLELGNVSSSIGAIDNIFIAGGNAFEDQRSS